MAFQPIADAEVQPGAIVSSSLMARLRDNQRLTYETAAEREPGDIPLAIWETGSQNWGDGSSIIYTAISPFIGGFRFAIDFGVAGSFVIQRNGEAVTAEITTSGTVDVAGWSQGDQIRFVGSATLGSTGSFSGEIRADRAGAVTGSLVFDVGASP